MAITRAISEQLFRILDSDSALNFEVAAGRALGIPIPLRDDAHPMKKFAFFVYCLGIFSFFTTMYLICEIVQAFLTLGSLDILTQNLALTVTHTAGFFKIVNLGIRGKGFLAILDLIDVMIARFADNDAKRILLRNNDRITKLVFVFFCSMVFATAVLSASALFDNAEKATQNFPYHAYFPGFVPDAIKALIMGLAVGWNGISIVVHDCFIVALMNQICAQVLILEESLKDLDGNAHKTAPIEQLKQCIRHHQMILHLRNEIESLFSHTLLVQFLASLLIFGLTGFQATVSSYRQFLVYAYCCCICTELLIYCWFAHQVIAQSDSLGYNAFITSWHVYGRDYGRILQMMIAKSIKPIELTGGGFFVISLDTFSSILVKSYSYINLIRQMYFGDKI